VDCGTYIADFLTAHADGELSGEQLRLAEEHVRGCTECANLLAEERALKTIVRERRGIIRTPPQVRGSILAALDAADRADAAASSTRPKRPRRNIVRPLRWAAPFAIAAAIAVVFIVLHRPAPAGAYPVFDAAIDNYQTFQDHFAPNVPSGSPGEIADAYITRKMPGYLWNFQPSGYKLIGGRLDQMPDGRTVTDTFYRADDGSAILCRFMTFANLKLPAEHSGEPFGEHRMYEYRGYTICLSYLPTGKYICILVSGKPMKQFMQDISASEY
jgi:anti-sigma factor RsiW